MRRDTDAPSGTVVLIGCIVSIGLWSGSSGLAAESEPELALIVRSHQDVAAREEVAEIAERLFEGIPESDHLHVVVFDEADRAYIALHLSNWVGISELRAYWIPQAEASDVSDWLESGDYQAAFEILVHEFGPQSRYVSDIGLDGLSEAEIEVGVGRLKDYYSLRQFETVEEADAAYHQWLARTLELLGR